MLLSLLLGISPVLQAAMAKGDLTSVELTTYYLSRIRGLDVGGLQSMNEMNPEALDIAAALDAQRAGGTVRGPLHGVPISLKDNIGAGHAMHTTAGATALEHARSDDDATAIGFTEADLDVLVPSGNRLAGAYAVAGYPALAAGATADGHRRLSPYVLAAGQAARARTCMRKRCETPISDVSSPA